jgi:uncharacterized protein YjiS (DUF1127 family)
MAILEIPAEMRRASSSGSLGRALEFVAHHVGLRVAAWQWKRSLERTRRALDKLDDFALADIGVVREPQGIVWIRADWAGQPRAIVQFAYSRSETAVDLEGICPFTGRACP